MEFVKLSQGQEKIKFMVQEGKNNWKLSLALRIREKLRNLVSVKRLVIGCLEVVWTKKESLLGY